jgi:hypothetical protein
MGAGARRIPHRGARAPAPPSARRHHHHRGAPPAHPVTTHTDVSGVAARTIAGTDGMGQPAVPSGGHTRTKDPKMFSNNGGDALTSEQAMTRAGPQQSHYICATRRTIPDVRAHRHRSWHHPGGPCAMSLRANDGLAQQAPHPTQSAPLCPRPNTPNCLIVDVPPRGSRIINSRNGSHRFHS